MKGLLLAGGTLAGLGALNIYLHSADKSEPKPTPHNISVILPTLNEEDCIQMTLESIKNQRLFTCPCRNGNRHDEIIVVDSGSTDSTLDIAKLYECRIINAPKGVLLSKNIGVESARGDVIFMAEADTYYPPHHLHTLLQHFNNPDVVIASAPTFFGGGAEMWAKLSRFGLNLTNYITQFSPGQNQAFRKDAFMCCGGYKILPNQSTNNFWVWHQVEVDFPIRIQKYGKRVFDWRAYCITSPRKWGKETCEIVVEQ